MASAFAPGAITNFFAIEYNSPTPSGATGGGYILSRGTTTAVALEPAEETKISTVVNGDPGYDARTTRRAVALLLAAAKIEARITLEQDVATPIGSGFGASAASATSAAYAVAAAAGFTKPRPQIAMFAHQAEILEQTGLGTVSVIYNAVGAGAITVPGAPGTAEFINVKIPRDMRLVTAFVAPFDKKDALSSPSISRRINGLGLKALQGFLRDPTLETLAEEGERFSAALGLESPEVKKLITLAKSSGAVRASQNMIGYSIHSLVDEAGAARVARALRGYSSEVRVDVFEVGSVKAGLVGSSRT